MKQKNKGLNVIGYTRGKFGLGEALRLNIQAARSQRIPLNLIDFEKIKKDPDYQFNLDYTVNLVQISLKDLETFFRVIDPNIFKFRYTVLFLMWESEYLPPQYAGNLSLFNEIWTASTFCKEIFEKVYRHPITVIPHPVEFKLNGRPVDNSIGFFDKNKFSFLFIFSYHSSFERKNPLFLLDAFIQAFPGNQEVELVIKTVGAENFKSDSKILLKKCAAYKNISVYNVDLDKNGIHHLINDCDCYVSMHHSEGFGLTLAEAMFFEKPTIATNYSGNTQFMNERNSFLVDYELGLIEKTDHNFSDKTVWAHPVMEDAIYQLQEVYNNSELRKARASYASRYIKEELSFHSIGKIIKKRLDSIYEECGDVIADQNVYLIQQLQFLKVENAHLRREIHRMKKNLIIRFVLFLKNKTRQFKNNLKTANS